VKHSSNSILVKKNPDEAKVEHAEEGLVTPAKKLARVEAAEVKVSNEHLNSPSLATQDTRTAG
jgi:hypothetical protein